MTVIPINPDVVSDQWAAIIRDDLITIGQTGAARVSAYVTTGGHLSEAQQEMGLGGEKWRAWVERVACMSYETAGRLMRVASYLPFQDRSIWNSLPPHAHTLDELKKLDPNVFGKYLAEGQIHPELTTSQAKRLLGGPDPKPVTAEVTAKRIGSLLTEPGVPAAVLANEHVSAMVREIAADALSERERELADLTADLDDRERGLEQREALSPDPDGDPEVVTLGFLERAVTDLRAAASEPPMGSSGGQEAYMALMDEVRQLVDRPVPHEAVHPVPLDTWPPVGMSDADAARVWREPVLSAVQSELDPGTDVDVAEVGGSVVLAFSTDGFRYRVTIQAEKESQ